MRRVVALLWICALQACGASAYAPNTNLWVIDRGENKGACTGTGALKIEPPTIVLNVDATTSPEDAVMKVEARQLDRHAAERIQTALQYNAQSWLSCIKDLNHFAKAEMQVKTGPSLSSLADFGLAPGENECLVKAMSAALAGIDYGQLEVLRIQLGYVHLDASSLRKAHGALRKSDIRAVITSHIAEVRTCYQYGVIGSPTLRGRVVVKFVVQADGSVDAITVQSSSLGSRGVECCIISSMRDWRFPPPMGGGVVIITYPFVLDYK